MSARRLRSMMRDWIRQVAERRRQALDEGLSETRGRIHRLQREHDLAMAAWLTYGRNRRQVENVDELLWLAKHSLRKMMSKRKRWDRCHDLVGGRR